MAASPSVGVIHKYAKSEHYQSIHKVILSGVTRSLSFIVPLTLTCFGTMSCLSFACLH